MDSDVSIGSEFLFSENWEALGYLGTLNSSPEYNRYKIEIEYDYERAGGNCNDSFDCDTEDLMIYFGNYSVSAQRPNMMPENGSSTILVSVNELNIGAGLLKMGLSYDAPLAVKYYIKRMRIYRH